ncbi:nickel insertion protein [Dethiothermospora halolimnae]|uniref:nickel insertion protein n=1 Tax=Dethiothermospora halolimnae TaxID=3114390 RepID=UPI003CCBECC8
MNPEIYSHLFDLLFEKGALDVYLTNIIMKKNRPGSKISVLCYIKDSGILENILFNETTTLGIRKYKVDREKLDREFIKIKTKYGKITVKLGLKDGKILKYAPEYEECKKIAKIKNIPLKDVYKEALSNVSEKLEN